MPITHSRPLVQFGVLVAFLGALAVAVSAVVASAPPWYPAARMIQVGWQPVVWNRYIPGTWSTGFETSAFTPCPGHLDEVAAGTTPWWAVFDEHSWSEARRTVWGNSTTLSDTTVFLVLVIDVSPAGRYGHLSAYAHEVAVRHVLRAEPARDDACAWALDEHGRRYGEYIPDASGRPPLAAPPRRPW